MIEGGECERTRVRGGTREGNVNDTEKGNVNESEKGSSRGECERD